jgi:ankyrin repeat protein
MTLIALAKANGHGEIVGLLAPVYKSHGFPETVEFVTPTPKAPLPEYRLSQLKQPMPEPSPNVKPVRNNASAPLGHYKNGEFDKVCKMVEEKVKIDIPDLYGWTVMHYAARDGNKQVETKC